MNDEEFWKTDAPTTLEEALQLLRFGMVLEKPLGDVDHVRTSRRMIACADFIERLSLASGEPVASWLPERDHSKPAARQGLFRKFVVERVDGSDRPGGKHHGCEYFVLDMVHDAHAPTALRAYAIACKDSHPQLSADLIARFGDASPDSVAVPEKIKDNCSCASCGCGNFDDAMRHGYSQGWNDCVDVMIGRTK